jgi:hypothetical protein
MKRRGFIARAGLLVMATSWRSVGEAALTSPSVASPTTFPVLNESSVLRASGGLCAPLTPFYDMPNFNRPVANAIPAFTARRARDGLQVTA